MSHISFREFDQASPNLAKSTASITRRSTNKKNNIYLLQLIRRYFGEYIIYSYP